MSRPRPRRDDISAQVRRSYRLAGPVRVVETLRCDCGIWLRPGVDHVCESDPNPPHRVRIVHGDVPTLTCLAGDWSIDCKPGTPLVTARRMAAAHLRDVSR